MRKFLVRAAVAVCGLLAILAAGLAVRFYLLAPIVQRPPSVKAPSDATSIARGQYLADHVAMCRNCHSESDSRQPGQPVKPGREYSGRDFFEIHDAGFPGYLRAPNLTPDTETGIARHSDGELLRAMREGVGRDGHALFMMPWKHYAEALSDEDSLAIIAYLRTLPAIHNDPGPTRVAFPLSMLVRSEPRPLAQPAPPMPSDPLERGRRLLALGNCDSCHSTHDAMHDPVPGQYLAGGDRFVLPGIVTAYAANLTSDPATGLGAYSDEEIIRILVEGKSRSGRPLYFMPFPEFRGMSEEDKRALVRALRAVPPIVHAVPPAQLGGTS